MKTRNFGTSDERTAGILLLTRLRPPKAHVARGLQLVALALQMAYYFESRAPIALAIYVTCATMLRPDRDNSCAQMADAHVVVIWSTVLEGCVHDGGSMRESADIERNRLVTCRSSMIPIHEAAR